MPSFPPGIHLKGGRAAAPVNRKLAVEFYESLLPIVAELHRKGLSLRAIAGELDRRGIKTRSGWDWSAHASKARAGPCTPGIRPRTGEPMNNEQAYREEAERLALLPRDDQRQLIAQHRAIATDKGVPKPDREEAKARCSDR